MFLFLICTFWVATSNNDSRYQHLRQIYIIFIYMYFVCHIINGAGFWFPSDSVSVHPAIHPLNHLSSDDFSMSDFWCKKWLEGRTDGRTNIQLCCDMKIEFFFIEIISFSHLFVGELRLWFVWAFLLRQKRNVYCCFYDLLIVFFSA